MARPLRGQPRGVSSGRSPGFRIFRRRAPSRTRDRHSIRRVQWFRARDVPGDSGGGRAGFSPASLTQTSQRSVEGDATYRVRVSRSSGPSRYDRPRAAGLHARLRPDAPRRVSGGGPGGGKIRGADHRDLPPARAGARRPGHAPAAGSVGGAFDPAASWTGPLRHAFRDPAPLGGKADAPPGGLGRRRDRRHGRHRGRRGSARDARIPGRLLDPGARRRRGRGAAPALAP